MKTPHITPVSNRSNVAVVAEQLEQLIIDGFWEPEQRIWSEAELYSKFHVGRSTVREAVNMLKAKNLVYTLPGLGTYVSKSADVDSNFVLTHIPDPESANDLANIMELRLGIEPINANFAAKRATPDEIHMLRLSHEERQSIDLPDPQLFAHNDMEFHMIIAQAARNPVTLDVMHMVRSFFLKQQLITSHQVSRRKKSMEFHHHILDAIANRDSSTAEKLMRQHMEETYEHLESLIVISKRASQRLRARETY